MPSKCPFLVLVRLIITEAVQVICSIPSAGLHSDVFNSKSGIISKALRLSSIEFRQQRKTYEPTAKAPVHLQPKPVAKPDR
jgi:hypothetical protein